MGLYVIGMYQKSKEKLPVANPQHTVHLLIFYVVKVGIGFHGQILRTQRTHQLNYHLTVAFS
jgi:hypothetical protein